MTICWPTTIHRFSISQRNLSRTLVRETKYDLRLSIEHLWPDLGNISEQWSQPSWLQARIQIEVVSFGTESTCFTLIANAGVQHFLKMLKCPASYLHAVVRLIRSAQARINVVQVSLDTACMLRLWGLTLTSKGTHNEHKSSFELPASLCFYLLKEEASFSIQ